MPPAGRSGSFVARVGLHVGRWLAAAAVALVGALVYTGTPPFDAVPQIGAGGGAGDTAARLVFWTLVGGLAGLVGEGPAGLVATWGGALLGYGLGLAHFGTDPDTATIFLFVTWLGIAVFVTPGYGLGRLLGGHLARPAEVAGPAVRPAPAPLASEDESPVTGGEHSRPPGPPAGPAVPVARVKGRVRGR